MKISAKKVIAIVIVLLLLVAILYVAWQLLEDNQGVRYTEDIADYKAPGYPMFDTIFLDSIPDSAHIMSFSNYSYWNEARDVFLELKFDSVESFEAYLSSLKTNYLNEVKDSLEPYNGFIEKQNPYNASYVDYMTGYHSAYTSGKNYSGFEIRVQEDETVFDCCYGIISYSYDELTVIQTTTYGYFRDIIHNYTPKYLLRFQVPLNQDHQYIHNWEQ